MVEYLKAFKRPFSGDKWIFLRALIPIYNLAVFGYIIECVRNTLQGKYELADWKSKGWFNKVFSPIGAFIVAFVFFMLPFFVVMYLVRIGDEFINSIIPYSSYVLFGILFFLASYYGIAGYISYIKNWKLEDIKYGKITKIVFSGKYFLAWLVNLIISWISIFFIFMEMNPYLSWVSMIVIWILYLPAWTIVAQAVREVELEKKLK